MKRDLPTAPKPDPENALIRALRMSAVHLRRRATELSEMHLSASAHSCKVAASRCEEEVQVEIGRMKNAGEASS